MNVNLPELEKENRRLRYLAERDWLTGLYNRCGMEQYINTYLQTGEDGTIIVMDIDGFKQINDQYGHVAGDRMLQYMARILEKTLPGNAFAGRSGGDEFVVFFYEKMNQERVRAYCERIEDCLKAISLSEEVHVKVSVTMDWASSDGQEDYVSVFDAADQKMMAKKRGRLCRNEDLKTDAKDRHEDLVRILEMMSSQHEDGCGFCVDYETFRHMYYLEVMRKKSMKYHIYMVLFALTDGHGMPPEIGHREQQMQSLGKNIIRYLQPGDVFCRYTSFQYLLMIFDRTAYETEQLIRKIRKDYAGDEQLKGISTTTVLFSEAVKCLEQMV